MKIRSAQTSDQEAIQSLVFHILSEFGLASDPKTTDRDLLEIEAFYHDRGGFFAVLEDGGRIVGSVGLAPLQEQGEEKTGEIRKMYLHPAYRGQGWGRKLLEYALLQARQRGFQVLTLETATILRDARALYERYGFQPWQAPHLSCRCDQAYRLLLSESAFLSKVSASPSVDESTT